MEKYYMQMGNVNVTFVLLRGEFEKPNFFSGKHCICISFLYYKL